MTGKVEIVNLALARLGDMLIQDLEEGSAAANQAKLFYEPSRRAVLRDFNWNFALKIDRLALLEDRPLDFNFAYALPADCLKAIRLRRRGARDYGEEDPGERFVLRSGTVCTDAKEAYLEYIRDVSDETEFDDKFIEAFSYKLAAELAAPLTGRFDLMNSFLNAYTVLVREAATLSARENRRILPENPYVEAR
nr:MAG TPA: tail tubular protein [Caudoviricetes sp.]